MRSKEDHSKGIRNWSGLAGTDAIVLSAFWLTQFRFREDLYFHYLDGALDPDIWSGFDANVHEVVQYPGFHQWLAVRRHWFSAAFQTYIDEKMGDPVEVVHFDDPVCSAGR
jgi:hypothetical protein